MRIPKHLALDIVTLSRRLRRVSPLVVASLLALAGLPVATAQGAEETPPVKPADVEPVEEESAEAQSDSYYYEVTVTATLTEKDTFAVPQPVSVVSAAQIQQSAAETATELLRELPGVDVNGVGASQPRPIIRGQRGQRVLLLRDGVRLNNSRRESDFGEIPAVTDISSLERVEVVRGPASVLYGSDAIGGVLNLITSRPYRKVAQGDLDGFLGVRFDSASGTRKGMLQLSGRLGERAGYTLEGTYRDADDYDAPAGSFGDITLSDDTPVQLTGVQDDSWRVMLGFDLNQRHSGSVEIERYRAGETGFGFVDPAAFDPGGAEIRIRYPSQTFEQLTLRHTGRDLDSALADRWQTSAWLRNNERSLVFDSFFPFFPGAGISVVLTNFTDIDTIGLRTEASKAIGGRHLLTYGLDAYQDDSFNTDTETVSLVGFGPPALLDFDDTPRIPFGQYTSTGVFLQDDMRLAERVNLILGGRYQRTNAQSDPTPGLDLEPFDVTEDAVVGAANLMFEATDNLRLVANVGQGFRSPNLVERLFEGAIPEEDAFLLRNPTLDPETSVNIDVGAKYRRKDAYFEVIFFRNDIEDGIRLGEIPGLFVDTDGDGTGDTQAVQYVNVDELRYEGVEAIVDWTWRGIIALGLNYTHLKAEDVRAKVPVADSYSDKLGFQARYTHPGKRFWVEYAVRYNGEQDDLLLSSNPIGDVIPSFTVHALRSNFDVFDERGVAVALGLSVENLTNELYSEVSNASFFRPEPGRSMHIDWRIRF